MMASKTWTARAGDRLSILLLEDDADLAAILKAFLESYSCKVTKLENGVEGLRRVMLEDFDVVLCDTVKPRFPGDKLYQAVHRVKPALCRRFLFMAGERSEPGYEAFLENIGAVTLWKPFEPGQLLAAIQSVLWRADELDVAEWSKALSKSRG
jgi:DNA-binding response OmpR family regulator